MCVVVLGDGAVSGCAGEKREKGVQDWVDRQVVKLGLCTSGEGEERLRGLQLPCPAATSYKSVLSIVTVREIDMDVVCPRFSL